MSEKRDDEREANATEDWRESVKQEVTTTTAERNYYQYMLEHDILTDCTFVVGPKDGETREFKAHRLHMARMSAVFEAMLLRGEMVEAKTGYVRVIDLSPNTFQLLLSSIYGEDPEMTTFQEAQNLAFAAHKYQMKALLDICVSQMGAFITPENIWTALETADLLQEARLKEKCVQILQIDTLRCITNPRILQASEENVALLLEQDELNVDDELLLVNTIMHWARQEARRRRLTGDDEGVRAVLEPRLLSLFRLLAMSPQQFMLGPGLAGWLTSDEKAVISECMKSKDFSKVPQYFCAITEKRKIVPEVVQGRVPPGAFICKRKIISTFPLNVCQSNVQCCVRLQETRPDDKIHRRNISLYRNFHFYSCAHATLIFRVKASCQWWGFQCASQIGATLLSARHPTYREDIVATTYTIRRTLFTGLERILIAETKYEQEVEYNSSMSVVFAEPVLLVPGHWFAVEIKFRQSDLSLGQYRNPSRSPSVCTAAGVEFVFQTDEHEGYNSENDGIVEGLIISLI